MRSFNPLRKNSVKALALSLLVVTAGAAAHAQDLVYDNYSTAAGTSTATNYGVTTGSTVGMAFNTGSSALSLTDVVFPQLSGGTNTPVFVAGETFAVNVRNANGTVGTALSLAGTFTVFNNGGGQADASVNGTFVLAPNSSYYFSLTAPTTGSNTTVLWNDATGTTSAGPKVADGATVPAGNISYSINSGTTSYFTTNPQIATVYASVVPEPSTVSMLALAVAGTLLVVSRSRASKIS